MKKTLRFLSCLLNIWVFSQYNNNYTDAVKGQFDVSPPSTSAFEQISSIGVNEAFGVANIQIPLFNVQEGNINVPIYLSYNSQGIKVNQFESNVGLGWSISNISITREIKDANDFDDSNFGVKKIGYFTKKAKNLNYVLNANPSGYRLHNVDMLPDIYSANLLSSNHKFYFDGVNDYKLLTRSSIIINAKVDSLINLPNYYFKVKDFYNIKIKDEQGLEYDFSDYNTAKFYSSEYSVTSNGPGLIHQDLPLISNWQVSKITDKINHREINFLYEEGNTFGRSSNYSSRYIYSGYYSRFVLPNNQGIRKGYYFDKLFPGWEDPGLTTKGFLSSGGTTNTWFPNPNIPTYNYNYVASSTYYTKNLNIKKIIYSQGYILFDYDRSLSKYGENIIKSISSYDYNDKLIKEFKFHYSYFGCSSQSLNGSPCLQRLKLDSIEEVNKGFIIMTYDEDIPLPHIQSKAFDYNGYYNGTEENLSSDSYTRMQDNVYYYPDKYEWSLLPFDIPADRDYINKHQIYYSNGSQNGNYSRQPNLSFAKAGILKSIQYPTGGKQEFIYGLNDFVIDGRAQGQVQGCGLRIEKTVLKDDTGLIQDEITYNYLDEFGRSSGEMIYPPFTGYPVTQIFTSYYDFSYQQIWTSYNGLPNFESDKLGMLFKIYDMPSESPIRYKRVETKKTGNGKIITEFVDKSDVTFPKSIYAPFANLTSVYLDNRFNFSDFLYTNSSYHLKNNSYNDIKVFNNVKVKTVFDQSGYKLKEDVSEYESITPTYEPFSANSYFIKPILDFSVVNTPNTSNYLDYANQINSQGSVYLGNIYSLNLLKKIKTTSWYKSTGNSQILEKYFKYSLNRHAMPFTHSFTKDSAGFVEGSYNWFFDILSNDIISLNIKNKVIGSANFSGYDILDDYDRPYNFLKKVYIEYNSDTYTSNLFKPKRIILDLGQSESVNTTFDRYDNKGNLLQSTKDGISTTYIYGYNQNYPIATIVGATYDQVMTAFAKDPNDNQAYLQLDIVNKSILDIDQNTENNLIKELDTFRANSDLANYQITTQTYDPLIGVTSATPPNGIREIYKYDSSNRLIEVKDINGRIIKENKYNYKQ